jgi:hypothetical protein
MMVRRCRDRYPQALSLTPQSTGIPIALNAIFDEGQQTVELSPDGVPISTVRPVIDLRLADLDPLLIIQPRHGDTVTIGARTFTVAEVQPAGGDSRRCYLTEAGS